MEHNPEFLCNWVCYILISTDFKRTYVGATDNLLRRLNDHNGINGISRGAKATKGRQWYPVVVVSGFKSKIACLSFETGIRRVNRRRCLKKYNYTQYNFTPIGRRVVDLYNLLYVDSPIKKWTSDGLCINWLESQYKPGHFILPKCTYQKEGIDVQ